MAALVAVNCPCGVEFQVRSSRLKVGRGRYCSRRCMYRYCTPGGRFQPGHKGHGPNSGQFKPGELTGDKHPLWKGDAAGYRSLHHRGAIARRFQ